MKRFSLLFAAAASVAIGSADAELSRYDAQHHAARFFRAAVQDSPNPDIAIRATDDAPDGYAPGHVSCPSDRPEIRAGTKLSPQELDWLPLRRNETIDPIRTLLKRIAIPGFDSDTYLSNVETNSTALPNIGLAVSGGGYRALLNGAGAISAWDSRSAGSDAKGNLGGLLQSATYLSGLSGGGWLVGSLFANNFTTVADSVAYSGIWSFQHSILAGPDQISLVRYYTDIIDEVDAKDKAGFDTSITDYWGRMLSFQLVNASEGGPGYTFSSIAQDADFKAGKTPLPLLIADGRAPGEKIISANSTVFEFNPWEMGSRDTSLGGHVPLKYAGTKFTDGKVADTDKCVEGFDNFGFVMGTSSSLFNQIVLYLKDKNNNYVPKDVPDIAVEALTKLLNALGEAENDIADWTPNPFRGFNSDHNNSSDSSRLTLVDGGEDLQNIPYYPHIDPNRKVDVVFSIDSSADTESGWPDGASPIATYERSLEPIAEGSSFPAVPGKDTILNLGYNTKPVFFGCNATNATSSSSDQPSPLIVYIPNYPYLYASNISTFQLTISPDERDAIIENGWAVATQLNSTRDPEWAVCVGCAMLSRSFDRTGTKVPDACATCFSRYCWDGTLNETKPAAYWPDYYSKPIVVKDSAAGILGVSISHVVLTTVVAILATLVHI